MAFVEASSFTAPVFSPEESFACSALQCAASVCKTSEHLLAERAPGLLGECDEDGLLVRVFTDRPTILIHSAIDRLVETETAGKPSLCPYM
ncbi:MAG: hypothetical protein ED559_13750 [Phycisphaera sp.]|nr:MAG: hypothetical protein ED559_13750 [Phycisphaera sp.]